MRFGVDMSDRVALQMAIAAQANELRTAVDPALMPQTTPEWVTRLAVSLGAIGAVHDEPSIDVEAYLLGHAADVLLWLEDLARERWA